MDIIYKIKIDILTYPHQYWGVLFFVSCMTCELIIISYRIYIVNLIILFTKQFELLFLSSIFR